MQSYQEMSKEELLKEKEHLEAEYKKFQQPCLWPYLSARQAHGMVQRRAGVCLQLG